MMIQIEVWYLYNFNRLGLLNDLWKYNLVNNTWEHVNGAKIEGTSSNYVIPYPGGLNGHAMAIDHSDTNIYVFGGYGLTDIGPSTILFVSF